MSPKKRTSLQDWIQDYYSPILHVLASQDAELVANKNNLTFTELLQPFSKLNSDVTIRDVDGVSYTVPTLCLNLVDFQKESHKLITQKVMYDRISEENCDQSEFVTKHFEKTSLDAPGYTPWFDIWMKMYLHSLPLNEHEFLKHVFGCMFVVSSGCTDPVQQFRNLTQMQQREQHSESRSAHFIAANTIKCYVFVHDGDGGVPLEHAQKQFSQVQNAFDSVNCHFLHVNCRNPENTEQQRMISDHWLQFSHRLNTVELRRENPAVNDPFSKPTNKTTETSTLKDGSGFEHPLSSAEISDFPSLQTKTVHLTQANSENIGRYLDQGDVERISTVMRDVVVNSVIPFSEKQMKLLHEIVVNRKSRSLFSGAKRWFGTSKPTVGASTSLVYTKDAPEIQVRKLADIYFLLKMYKSSHQHYYTIKKDFQADEAWSYYAPAVELAALSLFMLSLTDQGKKYRADYMEEAITKYLTLCQSPEFAVRATLFDAMCLKHQGLFVEAANCYIKMTNELSDLRSAMLLEQAAYCYLLSNPPNIRKYGFHIVLSGYRFAKTGSCKKHAVRLYGQGAQVYDQKGWLLSSEHILYSLGHQKFMLKDFSSSSEFFNNLISVSSGMNHLQQMVHLREYFLVHHARFKEDQSVVMLSTPQILSQQISLNLHEEKQPEDGSTLPWQAVERSVLEGIRGQEVLFLSHTTQPFFSNKTQNNLGPQGVVGETIYVTLPIKNVFNTPLMIRKSFLLWKFTNSNGELLSNDNGQKATDVDVSTVDSVTIESNSVANVLFEIRGNAIGTLNIIGLEYSLKALFPNKEPTDHQIRGKQYFQVSGPRLNTVKDHKTKVTYGTDHRLTVVLRGPQPRLSAKLKTPESLFSGELRCVELDLVNTSSVPLCNLHVASTRPGLLSFGKSRNLPLYEIPLVVKSEPPLRVFLPDGTATQTSFDVVPVPLPDSHNGQLAPEGTVTLPVWLRADSVGDRVFEDLYFYYENPDRTTDKVYYRLVNLPLRIKLQSSVEGGAEVQQISPAEGSSLLLRLKNLSKEGEEKLKSIEITQVTMVSHDSKIYSVESTEASKHVSRGETATFSLTAKSDDRLTNEAASSAPGTKIQQGSPVQFSGIACGQNKGHGIHLPPFLDFLKPYFTFNVGKKWNPPILTDDLLVVMWRGQTSQPILGQTVIALPRPKDQVEDRKKAVKFCNSHRLSLDYPKQVYHNPSISPFSRVNVRLELDIVNEDPNQQRSSDENSSFDEFQAEFRVRDVEKGAKWVGLSDCVKRSKERSFLLNLGMIVSTFGVFHLRSVQYRIRRLENGVVPNKDQSDDGFRNVDVCFTVLPGGN